MCSIPLTGRPKVPPPSGLLLLAVLLVLPFLHGCGNNQYKAVPECAITTPPDVKRFAQGNPDERLVLMSNAYISQTKNVNDCNAKIRLVNASNKAVDN
ncbi:hypothetical protein PA10_00300 [Pseudomonas phage pPa_SNUABM_DT01]|nr:hypothetical protein PA10_00300 [Pseudomonas phage pPa_SNUABM_DT01]